MAEPKVVVKKVKPYPIESQAIVNAETISGQILKLKLNGCLFVTQQALMHVGKLYEIRFVLPVSRTPLQIFGKVIKSYDRMTQVVPESGASGQEATASATQDNSAEKAAPVEAAPVLKAKPKMERLVELQFVKISDLQRNVIEQFLVKIKQKDML